MIVKRDEMEICKSKGSNINVSCIYLSIYLSIIKYGYILIVYIKLYLNRHILCKSILYDITIFPYHLNMWYQN